MDGTRPDGGVFYADERTVYVSFPGRLGEIETDYCSGQYEMVAEETATDVSVTVFRILPAVQPAETPCEASLTYALMSVDLDEPLGDRTLTTGSNVVNPAFVDQRLMPMWVPDHWQAQEGPCHSVGSCWLRFGQVSVEIQAMADKPGVGIVRGNPMHEDVSIRGVDDGAVVTRASTGVHRLGFDDAGWFYDFIAQPSVDRDELISFARAFEAPATVEALSELPNEIAKQYLEGAGWQYNDGAGPIERDGISFPSDGSDESLRFTSDEAPVDLLTLVTGCKVAAYRIAWNEDGFVINSEFTYEETTNETCDYEATEGLVVTPLFVGQQILVQRDPSNLIRVILTPADPGDEPWTISLTGRGRS